jgi:ethanolamine ammonia-lyase small subunit
MNNAPVHGAADPLPRAAPQQPTEKAAQQPAEQSAAQPGANHGDAWQALRRFTPARIALGRAGQSLPTRALLEFGLAQAQARDAVFHPSQQAPLLAQLAAQGYTALGVRSAAADRQQYLRRPDLGRRLDDASRERLRHWAAGARQAPLDIVFVVADGLSAQAAARHALPLLRSLDALPQDWHRGPVVVAELARVALGDEIGALMGARHVAVLIGERPGLSAPDSLGIYLTHSPRLGRTDAERNCISNIRPEGLTYAAAAHRLRYLLAGAFRLGRTGIDLKDESRASGPDKALAADATAEPAAFARLSPPR